MKENPIGKPAFLLDLLDILPDAVLVTNGEGVVLGANSEATALLGYLESEFCGALIETFFVNGQPALPKAKAADRSSRECSPSRQHGLEVSLKKKDGRTIIAELSLSTLWNLEECYTILILRDICSRIAMTTRLKCSEDRYHSYFENSRIASYLTDAEGILIDANLAFSELLGYSRDELQGSHVGDLYVDPSKREKSSQTAIRYGLEVKEEVEFKAKDGTRITVHESLRGRYNLDGTLIELQGVLEYEPESLGGHRSRNPSRSRVDELQHIPGFAFWEWAPDAGSLSVTGELCREFGDTHGRSVLTYAEALEKIHPEDRGSVRQAINGLEQGNPLQVRCRVIAPGGEVRYVEMAGESRYIGEQGPRSGVGVVRDVTEEVETLKSARKQISQMSVLREIDAVITGSLDLSISLDVLLEKGRDALGADAISLLLFRPGLYDMEYFCGQGFSSNRVKESSIRLGEGLCGQAAIEGQTLVIPKLSSAEGFLRQELIEEEGFVSYAGVPSMRVGELRGYLEVFHRKPFQADHIWLTFLETLAAQAAVAVDVADIFKQQKVANRQLTMAYDATIEGWARALALRDRETEDHAQRVTEMAVKLARRMGCSEEQVSHIRRGALLHDIGKIGTPDSILRKPGPLTEEEMAIVRKHPDYSYRLLSPIEFFRPSIDIPYCHHERWDGSGYPRGLRGAEIPKPARIFAVVDVWDALTSARPYSEAWPAKEVREYLKAHSGTQFDPEVVESFLPLLEEGRKAV